MTPFANTFSSLLAVFGGLLAAILTAFTRILSGGTLFALALLMPTLVGCVGLNWKINGQGRWVIGFVADNQIYIGQEADGDKNDARASTEVRLYQDSKDEVPGAARTTEVDLP